MTTSPKPLKRLPESPSAENLHKQAKRLAKAEGLQLAAAQRRLANEYGYQNWAALMDAVTARFVPLLPLRGLVAFPHETYPIYIGRPQSIRAIEAAANGNRTILMVTQKDAVVAKPSADNLHAIGTLGSVSAWIKLGDGTIKAEIVAEHRARVSAFVLEEDSYQAQCERIPEPSDRSPELDALMRSIVTAFDAYAVHESRIPLDVAKSFNASLAAIAIPGTLADKLAGHLKLSIEDKQALLQTLEVRDRLEKIRAHLDRKYT